MDHNDLRESRLDLRDHVDLRNLCKCDDCGHRCQADELGIILNAAERLPPGDEVPAGECPECGALAYVVKDLKLPPTPKPVDLKVYRVEVFMRGTVVVETVASNEDFASDAAYRMAERGSYAASTIHIDEFEPPSERNYTINENVAATAALKSATKART